MNAQRSGNSAGPPGGRRWRAGILALAMLAACRRDAEAPSARAGGSEVEPSASDAAADEEPFLAVTGAPPLNQQVAEPREAPGRAMDVTDRAVTATGGEARVVAANRARSRFEWKVTLTNRTDEPYTVERLDVELVDRDGVAIEAGSLQDVELAPREERVVSGEVLVPAAAVPRVHAVRPVLR